MPLTQGMLLNQRYRIEEPLGQGGFGAVYRAWDLNLDLPCAVKENLNTTKSSESQFRREASMLATLHHRNLPRVIDHFFVPEQGQYLVMDFVEGEDLKSMLDRSSAPIPEAQVLDWILQVCDALIYLHEQQPQIIHRDIKPANIRITARGKAMLVDFGIAKVFNTSLATTQGARALTPGFAPQEQYGLGKTDERSDVYALGATLYNLLTGQTPVESVLRSANPLPAPRAINPALSRKVENIILKAMEISPDQRYQSVAEVKAALVAETPVQTVLSGATTRVESVLADSPAPGTVVTPTRPVAGGRPRWRVYALLSIVLIVLGVGGFFAGQELIRGAGNPTQTPAATSTAAVTPTRTRAPTPTPVLAPTVIPRPASLGQ